MDVKQKKIGIYKIISPTNRIYIGQSIDIDFRFSYYKKLNCKVQRRLYNSLLKYGPENHIFEILELCVIDELNKLERKWQDYYDVTGKSGLNLCLVNTEDKRRVFNEESVEIMKKKLSLLHTGDRNPFYGKKHTKETCIKMGLSRIGNKNALGNKREIGCNSPKAKIILDLDVGIFYSIGELSNNLKISVYKLKQHIKNSKKYIIC